MSVSVLGVWYALHDISFTELVAVARRVHIAPFLTAIALVTLTFPLRTIRWRYLLQLDGKKLPFLPLWHATAIGFMANNILPARAGEVARIYAAGKLTDVSYSASFASIAIERIFDGLIILLLIIFSWSGFARQIRAEIIRLKQMDYVAYSKLSGASTVRLFGRHLFPGVFNTVLVIATLQVGNLIIAESSLSFLGVGIPAPRPAWGVMVADGKNFISFAYWISLFPGLAIFLLVYALNFIGDWTRDRLDPRLRQIS